MPLYKFEGAKDGNDYTNKIVLEGTVENPKRSIALGGEAEMSTAEVDALKDRYDFSKVDGSSSSSDKGDK